MESTDGGVRLFFQPIDGISSKYNSTVRNSTRPNDESESVDDEKSALGNSLIRRMSETFTQE